MQCVKSKHVSVYTNYQQHIRGQNITGLICFYVAIVEHILYEDFDHAAVILLGGEVTTDQMCTEHK